MESLYPVSPFTRRVELSQIWHRGSSVRIDSLANDLKPVSDRTAPTTEPLQPAMAHSVCMGFELKASGRMLQPDRAVPRGAEKVQRSGKTCVPFIAQGIGSRGAGADASRAAGQPRRGGDAARCGGGAGGHPGAAVRHLRRPAGRQHEGPHSLPASPLNACNCRVFTTLRPSDYVITMAACMSTTQCLELCAWSTRLRWGLHPGLARQPLTCHCG